MSVPSTTARFFLQRAIPRISSRRTAVLAISCQWENSSAVQALFRSPKNRRFLSSTATSSVDDNDNDDDNPDEGDSTSAAGTDRRQEAIRQAFEGIWNEHFQALKAHLQQLRKENPESPEQPDPTDETLKRWFLSQRYQCQQKDQGEDTISDERQRKLESLGLPIYPRDDFWERRYQQLIQFVDKHGCFPYDKDVETLAEEEDRKLYWWCKNQKKAYAIYKRRKNQEHTNMTPEREEKLDAIGFCWNEHEASWLRRYRELDAYRKHHGDCLVPQEYPANPSLAVWVGEQRNQLKRLKDGKPSTMTAERYRLLNEIEFSWNVWDARWMQRYKELEEHVRLNGLGSFPSYKDNRRLNSWLLVQKRQLQKMENGDRSTMTEERRGLLQRLGIF